MGDDDGPAVLLIERVGAASSRLRLQGCDAALSCRQLRRSLYSAAPPATGGNKLRVSNAYGEAVGCNVMFVRSARACVRSWVARLGTVRGVCAAESAEWPGVVYYDLLEWMVCAG